MNSVVDEILGLKTSLGNVAGHLPKDKWQGRPSRGEDLTQAMNIALLAPDSEEAQFDYITNLLKKENKDLKTEEFKIKNQWNRLRVKIFI